MHTHLTIFKKGLILVSVPLLVQAIFIGMLIQTQLEAAAAHRWADHTREVIARVEEIYRALLEGYTGLRILVVSQNASASAPFRDALLSLPTRLADLRALVSDNEDQQHRIDLVAEQARTFREWLAAEEERMRSGERRRALELLEEGTRLIGVVRTTTDQVLATEARLYRARALRLERSTRRQTLALVVGGGAFLGTTLMLSLLFLHAVIRRLAVLKENARAYAAGRGLVPPLGGTDEVAEVDRAFHEMAASLDQQKQENEMFVYSVSHDLRSPLINLQGFSEELSLSYRDLRNLFHQPEVPPAVRDKGLGLLTENIDDSIRYIQTAVGRLARIIDALLRLSRAGRVEYQMQPLDVPVMVRKIIDALHDTISSKGAEVIVGDLAPAWGDPTAVEQIFANLISNAVHYLDGSRSGRIEVGTTDAPLPTPMAGFHVYFVKDNGLGIPEAYHQRVFTAFNRLQANVAQGEGIGLALVRRMVERHGGKIWLESAAGIGTTFFVALPASAPEGEKRMDQNRPPAPLAPQGERRKWPLSRS
jgi:signal transduction histidine kinase